MTDREREREREGGGEERGREGGRERERERGGGDFFNSQSAMTVILGSDRVHRCRLKMSVVSSVH